MKTKFGVTMPILNQEYTTFPKMAKAAEDAGFDSVWDYEFYRNRFVIHGLTSQVTSRIALATGLATTINRTPFEMANAALDIDELSGGRTILGIGMGAAGFADVFTGGPYDHPAPRIREYIQAMRCAWRHLDTGEPVEFSGKYHSFATPPFNPFGGRRSVIRQDIPVYVAALRPTMLKLAGEVADGVIGYMMTPRFVTEMVIPNITEGARRAGRDPSTIDIASETICSISDDRDEAYRRARIQVGIYMSYPVSAPLVDIMGLQSEREAVLQAPDDQGSGRAAGRGGRQARRRVQHHRHPGRGPQEGRRVRGQAAAHPAAHPVRAAAGAGRQRRRLRQHREHLLPMTTSR
ncbi:MAG TPA: LLM class flavin-dependent oxidoreductase [Pseudonocardia sp.]|jgi:alkanesulfonate monooxygenase SsuD/methylene tetrahydromethanopterin reductase-like flavin-dependent oxidoreductase (luciferase family)|nr:LLM class flavin-dependent oxidoreductase [Pseudonocardia sp.]